MALLDLSYDTVTGQIKAAVAAASGSATPLVVSGVYAIPVGQTLYRESITVQSGGQIVGQAGATLVKV